MSGLMLLVIAFALSVDAFFACVSSGLKRVEQRNFKELLQIAMTFGGLAFIAPLIGWFVGASFKSLIAPYDHWIAFVLLGLLGAKSILEAFAPKEKNIINPISANRLWALMIAAVATNIDGASFGVIAPTLDISIVLASLWIGAITGVFATVGAMLGNVIGRRSNRIAEFLAGVLLIAIGLRIVIQHLSDPTQH